MLNSSANSQSLHIDISKIKKCFIRKYDFDKNAMVFYKVIQKSVANLPDTIDYHVYLMKKSTNDNIDAYLKINSTNVIFLNDSIYTVYPDKKRISKSISKANLVWFQLINENNPAYDSKKFFSYLKKKDSIYFDSLSGVCSAIFRNNNLTVSYKFSLNDTSLISYKKEVLKDGVCVQYSEVQYVNDSIDFNMIEPYELMNKIMEGTQRYSNEKKPFSEDSLFDRYHYNLSGKTVNLLDYDSKLYLIDLWYIGCKPCMEAIPDIIKINEDFPNIKVLGINTVNSDTSYIKRYIVKNKINYEMLLNSDLNKKYRTPYPCFLILDENLTIKKIFVGYSKENIKQIRTFLNHFSL